MKYEEAVAVGTARSTAAAAVLEASTGLKAQAVCAVRPPGRACEPEAGRWRPVGRESWRCSPTRATRIPSWG